MSKALFSIILISFFVLAACSGKKDIKHDAQFDPEKSIARANELIDRKDYEDARKLLLEVKNRDTTKKSAPIAQLRIADSYTKEEEYELANEEYRKFIEMYPDNKYASYAQYQIATNHFVQIESPERGFGAAAKALEEFEKLKKMFPRNPYKEVLELKIEKCRNIMAEYEFIVAEFYLKKGAYNAALGRFQGVIAKYPSYNKEPRVLYNIALIYKKLGENNKALEYVTRLIEKYPNDSLIKEAKKEFPDTAR